MTELDASGFPQVRLVVSVLDAQGRPVKGLAAGDLAILEDGSPVSDASVALASKTSPVALALVLDTGASMGTAGVAAAKAAVVAMIDALGADDEVALLTFSGTVATARALTADKASLRAATAGATLSQGSTAIYDAVAIALDALRAARSGSRPAIVLLTDGRDTESSRPREQVLASLASAGHPVHVVGFGPNPDLASLRRLATATAGSQLIQAPSPAELAPVYASLAEQILTKYSVAYSSRRTALRDGAPVTLEVRLLRGGVLLGAASATFVVPAGRGAPQSPPAAAAPAPVLAIPDRDAETLAGIAAILGAGAVMLIFLALGQVSRTFAGTMRVRRRFGAIVGAVDGRREDERRRPFSERVVRPILAAIARPLLRIAPGTFLRSARQDLVSAGAPLGLGPTEFIGLRLGAAAAGAGAGMAALAFLPASPILFAAVPLGALGGFMLPRVALATTGRARRRAILRVFPSALDILAVSLEAGLRFDAAIAHVARTFSDPLAGEFRRLFVEFQMGRPRTEAMRDFARRTGLEEAARFVEAIAQAEALGVPYSRVIQTQAAEIRTRQRQRAEEVARVAPVKMVIPMVLFIFPALFIVILGPAVPRMAQMFSGPF